jgi:glucan endo-1,3-beta-D-glucosidase
VWASAGQDAVNQEIAALKQAINLWPQDLKTRVIGISVGSEDLYRSSPQGVANNAGVGATSDQIVSYIKQVRTALKGTVLANVKVGHVDTWTAWELPENAKVVNNVDWLGHNSFPYFETTKSNPIGQAKTLFYDGLSHTEGAAKGKPVWVTETGWPTKGPSKHDQQVLLLRRCTDD